MKNLIFLFGICFLATITCQGAGQDPGRVLVSVRRVYTIPETENTKLIFDWLELVKRIPSLKPTNLKVTDQHFGQLLPVQILDENSDGKPDKISFDYTFASAEPVFSFMVSADGKGSSVTKSPKIVIDSRMVLDYMLPCTTNLKGSKPDKSYAEQIVESTLHAYPNVKDLSIISPGKWTYEYGFFLNGTFKLWEKTKNENYITYIKQWVDNFITPDGKFKEGAYNMFEHRLDDILPGRLCISLYQLTGEEKYKKIADRFIVQLTNQPKTIEGGYWHKQIYPFQMWLDGIYMGDIFSMQYAAAFQSPQWFEESVKQIKLMYDHAYDPATGLLFHGWDESKNKVWADPVKGTSPELWSRAIGWYAMALIECLDYLPANHPERQNIQAMFQKLCESIRNFQDKKTGLWFQVINRGSLSDNWIETSASAMFTYAFAKGYHKNLLDKTYGDAAERAYAALISNYVYADSRGDIHLDQGVKVGSLNPKNSKGDYLYYISSERRLDDYKGLAALLYASIELNK